MINKWWKLLIILIIYYGKVIGDEPNWESLNVPPLIYGRVVNGKGVKMLRHKLSDRHSNAAEIAVDESVKWQNGITPRPILKSDGVVRFPYGEYQPTITCKPLNLCDIELQENEQIQGILIGDSIRWNDGDQGIPVVYSGTAAKLIPHLVLKPSQSGLETTLMITTSKRTYMIKLCSSSHGYVERAGFYYPREELVHYGLTAAQIKKKAMESSGINAVIRKSLTGSAKVGSLSNSSGKLNYKYSIIGNNYSWKPIQVFDDSISVFIRMPDSIDSRNLPGICVLNTNDDSHCELVNFRYKDHFFIIDQLFDKVRLVNGFGSNAETIMITSKETAGGIRHRGWLHLFGK